MSGFTARWKELTKEGWKARRPTGLAVSHTYLRTGKTKKDVRGVDYFIGEEELMDYLDHVDLEALKNAETDTAVAAIAGDVPNGGGAATAEMTGSGDMNVLPPQANPATPSDGSSRRQGVGDVDAEDRVEEHDVSASQVADESDLSPESDGIPSPMLRCESPHVTTPRSQRVDIGSDYSASSPALQRSLDDAFEEVDENGRQVAESRRPGGSTAISLADINIVQASEDPTEFAAMESNAENDDGASDGDDGSLGVDSAEDGEDETADELDVVFDESLLDAVGGIAQISRGTINADTLKDMSVNGWSKPVSYSPYPYLDQPYEVRPMESLRKDYPRLYEGTYGPTPRALEAATTVSGALFYFVKPSLWEQIAEASNTYFEEKLDERVDEQYAKQVAREKKKPGFKKSSHAEIKAWLLQTPDRHHTSRALPTRKKLEHHWKTTSEGAIPRGNFGAFMKRDRFMHVSRNLHFSSSSDSRATQDRAWKLRPVIEALQARFQAGYVPPPVMAFDEAMLPSRSSFNRMRVYMKDKPHKWGTKLFMLCCSTSAYCIRFEVYCGKRQPDGTSSSSDARSGPDTVVRNLINEFGPTGSSEMRLIVTDRFYTAPTLSMQLLSLGFYSIGTVMTNRRGLCKEIIQKKKSRPANVHRGTYTAVENKLVPSIKALCWWDNRPVHMLAAGGSVKPDRVVRREKSGEQVEVMCPRILKDYQTIMGGVDVHDQLCLQRYSLQLALKYKKYYKSLFLGFLDLAIVNAFIVYNSRRVADGKSKLSHVKFLKQLHLELVQLEGSDWDTLRRTDCTPTKSKQPPRQPSL